MAKPHSHAYHFAGYGGSTGTMVCMTCNQPIFGHAHDWMSQVRPTKWDWKYEVFHRKCCKDQSGWEKLEREAKSAADKRASSMAVLREAAEKIGVSDPIIFAQLAAEALGEGDLDGHYFGLYGSC